MEGPSVQDKAQGRLWQHWVSLMSHGVTCAPPTTTQLITHSGGEGGGKNDASKMWPCADQAFCPVPPRLYMESNDLSLRQCGVRSIICDICDTACILEMHFHGVNLSVKPSRRQDIHITLRVQQLLCSSGEDACGLTRILALSHKVNCASVNVARLRRVFHLYNWHTPMKPKTDAVYILIKICTTASSKVLYTTHLDLHTVTHTHTHK